MTALTTRTVAATSIAELQQQFIELLPEVQRYAEVSFRSRPDRYREDLVADVVGIAWRWFVRLSRQGKRPAEFARTLCRFVVLAAKDGRSIGGRRNRRDLHAALARDPHLRVHSLETRCPRRGAAWRDLLAETRGFPPDQTAATRIDFDDWRSALSPRNRRIVDLLAAGETSKVVAKTLQISPARMTQLRQQLAKNWKELQRDEDRDGEDGASATPRSCGDRAVAGRHGPVR